MINTQTNNPTSGRFIQHFLPRESVILLAVEQS